MHGWVTRAWQERGCRSRLLYAAPSLDHVEQFGARYEEWGMYMRDERPTGVPAEQLAIRLQLQGLRLDRKLAALRAMATQTSGLLALVDAELYAAKLAEESFVEAARATRC